MQAHWTHPRGIPRSIAFTLGAVAGYVDSCTFLGLFGLFVAQVTGSFVFAGAQLVEHDPHLNVKLLAMPMFFIASVVTAVIVECASRRGHPPCLWALVFQWILLVGFLVTGLIGEPFGNANAPLAAAVAFFGISAMGAQAVVGRNLVAPQISTNVMTNNLTQLAFDLTGLFMARAALRRAADDRESQERLSSARASVAGLWPVLLGFLIGTLVGAFAYAAFGFLCVIVAILISSGLVGWAYADWCRQRGALSQ
jgi:uncharacterized membrane protein YoaK (UPF0700 family)